MVAHRQRGRDTDRGLNLPEVAGSLIVIAVGGVALWEASRYSFGDPGRIGPGFFPLLAATVLVLCGAGVIFRSRREASVRDFRLRRFARVFVPVVGSLLMFALLVRTAGFMPAMAGSVVVASFANGRPRVSTLLLAGGVAVVGTLVFIYGLGIRMPAFVW